MSDSLPSNCHQKLAILILSIRSPTGYRHCRGDVNQRMSHHIIPVDNVSKATCTASFALNKSLLKKFRICKKLNIIIPMPLRNPGEGLRSPDSIANYGIMREGWIKEERCSYFDGAEAEWSRCDKCQSPPVAGSLQRMDQDIVMKAAQMERQLQQSMCREMVDV